jgi:phage baseplate assembly protein V
MLAELKRLINNIVCFGTISQTKSSAGQALARVKVMDRETDFLPVVSFSNSFKKHFIPVRVGEQVVMFSPFGEASGGFIIRSIFNKSAKEPILANEHTEVMEYEDGTVITYDTKAKELKINASDKITIICKGATVIADSVDITATTSNTGDVTINGNLTVAGDVSSSGNISDSAGNLTTHQHNTTDGATALPR